MIALITAVTAILLLIFDPLIMADTGDRIELERGHPRWDKMWATGIQPGEKFDALEPLPALVKMVEEGSVPSGRALVPGCGRGYDVVLLASSERHCTGLDISPIAISVAENFFAGLPPEQKPARESVTFTAASFFDLPEDSDNKFNFVYDYTFFCALDPSVRELWASKMSAIIASGGELCTIIFPIGDKAGGPPFAVTFEDYKSVLEPVGFEVFQLELLPPELCHKGRDGVAVFHPSDGSSATTMATGIGRWRRR